MEYPRATGLNQGGFLGSGFKEHWGDVGIGLGGDKKGIQL